MPMSLTVETSRQYSRWISSASLGDTSHGCNCRTFTGDLQAWLLTAEIMEHIEVIERILVLAGEWFHPYYSLADGRWQ